MGKKPTDIMPTVTALEKLLTEYQEQVKTDREKLAEQKETTQAVVSAAEDAMNLAVIAGDGEAYHNAKKERDQAADTLEMIEKKVQYYDSHRAMTAAELEQYTDQAAAELYEVMGPAAKEIEAAHAREVELGEEIANEAHRAFDVLCQVQRVMCADGKSLTTPGHKISAFSGLCVSFKGWTTSSASHIRQTDFEKTFGFGEV